MGTVTPIRRPDPVDTAQDFAASMERRLFSRSRFRRAKLMDALAVSLLMALMAALGVVVFAASARADGVLQPDEEVYAIAWAPDICNVIDNRPNLRGVINVAQMVIADGWRPDEAVDIVNASVASTCPEHWPLLVAVGRAARGENGGLT